ncbi:cytidylate kinase [Desulfatibacillum alkenivorans DSM 16219]|jgi:cytidylate kinase|uniref:Cytidylate kinase n=1 Tax=Desulfatibacillum alkenivorans DSM 16219 TaxID=1121393 RepID=A0A1M6HTR3_9BACT|nr:(d)CMP kinase [Desulfatibacillum alkenivorans]SHJ25514.1 cytidylate kinase [Desulfatibacillum alkenivorans DSM 16219]
MKKILVTIDGPAGAGKTTVSRAVALELGYTFVDTGALYRGLAVVVNQKGVDPNDDAALAAVCKDLELSLIPEEDKTRVIANGEDITDKLRTPEISMTASAVSARPLVREWLLGIQRDFGEKGGAVFEGRDMGTVVFPNAEAKFFLHADPNIRARRRHRELLEKGMAVTEDDVAKDMEKRDKDDSSRAVAPLKPAEDAILVDSSQLNIEEAVWVILDWIKKKLK